MSRKITGRSQKPRELRRRVMLPARMRTAAGWSDARILNVSSRGLMVHASLSALECGVVELWHGDLAISARVVWREGTKAGLQSEDRIAVDEILSLGGSAALQLSAEPFRGVERRKRARTHEDSRIRARAFEFASVVMIAGALAVGFGFWVSEALAQPLSAVQSALAG